MIKKTIATGGMLAAFLLFPNFVSADIILGRSGAFLQGKVISEDNKSIKFKNANGSVEKINKELIASVIKNEENLSLNPEEAYSNKAKSIPPLDAKAHYELGIFCMENSLMDCARKEFNRAIELAPAYKETVFKQMEYIDSVYREAEKIAETSTKAVKSEIVVPYSGFQRDAVILFIKSLRDDADRNAYYREYNYMGIKFKPRTLTPDAPLSEDERKNWEAALHCYEIVKQDPAKKVLAAGILQAEIQECEDWLKKNGVARKQEEMMGEGYSTK